MTKTFTSLFVCLLLASPLAAGDAPEASVRGDYLEVRSTDVYVGSCFANSEVGLFGKEAVLAWRVNEGLWKGVPLHGLSVVAVVRSDATLGDSFNPPSDTRALIVVDEKADAAQREALADLARSLSAELVHEFIGTRTAPIEMTMGLHVGQECDGQATLRAGDLAELKVRGLHHGHDRCANDELQYEPLTRVAQAAPGFTEVNRFTGEGLDRAWSSPNRRSAFFGTFAH